MQSKGKRSRKKTKTVEVLKFIPVLVLFWYYIKTKENTMAYPEYLFNSLVLIMFFSLSLINFKKTIYEYRTLRNKIDKGIYIFFHLAKNIIFSYFLSGIILLPLNLYNRNYSKKNPIEIIECKITGLTDYTQNSCFYYEYKGEESIIYGYRKIMSDIYRNKNYSDYLFVAKVRKGLLDTYIIESWDIIKK